jgi:hypothetical protein
MKPNAWSFSALESFENCPKQYYETKIAKRWPFESTAEMDWGKDVHKRFEHYLLHRTPLSADLETHREFLDRFLAQPGELAGEERIALDVNMRPCAYFAKDVQVWWRGQVDARKRWREGGFSHILDHKTGKVKNNYDQLKLFAIFEFISCPEIHTVKIEYYWTQIKGTNGETYTRDQLPALIAYFVPRLHAFADAFLTNTWTPKTSGLCNGWCPVKTCEFWKPKRPQRT